MAYLNLQKAEEAIKYQHHNNSIVYHLNIYLNTLRYFNTIVEEIPSAKYQRARALVLQEKYKEALQDLEESSQLLEAGAIEKTDYCIPSFIIHCFIIIIIFDNAYIT